MLNLNKIILAGYAGQDAKLRYLNNGMPVTRFSLATSESYVANDGKIIKTTDWHNIAVWRNLAEKVAKEVKKGAGIYLEGKLKTHRWYGNDGVMHTTTEIYAETVLVVSQPKEQEQSKIPEIGDVFNNNIDNIPSNLPEFDDGLPF